MNDTDTKDITLATVRERAVRLLAIREHGRQELQEKLRQRDLPEDLIVPVLDQLADQGLQCDVRFAESFTRMRVSRGYGSDKIRSDLQARHLERSTIEGAVRDCGADWVQIACDALNKKFLGKSLVVQCPDHSPDHSLSETSRVAGGAVDRALLARMQRYLHRRGFKPSELSSAVEKFTQTYQYFETDTDH